MSKNHRNVKGKNNYFYGKHFKGKEHPFYGQHHSNETKQKLKKSLLNKNGKTVRCIEENKIFPSAKEAARYYNMKTASLFLPVVEDKEKLQINFIGNIFNF